MSLRGQAISTQGCPAVSTSAETLASGREFLGSLQPAVALAGPEHMIAAVERVEGIYEAFPELELAYPRQTLIEALSAAADRLPHELAVPVLMFCVALDPAGVASIGRLLESVSWSGQSDAIMGILRALSRPRGFTWVDVAPAIAQLLRQGRRDIAIELISEVIGRFTLAQDQDALQLGELLKNLLHDSDNSEAVDPLLLATTVWSARNRLQRAALLPPNATRNGAFLALAGRVAEKLSLSSLAPPAPELPAHLGWRSGRLSFAEFAAQWSVASGFSVECLPNMSIGSGGERRDGIVRAITGQAGHVVYGPYLQLPPGEYRVQIHLEAKPSGQRIFRRQKLAVLEVVAETGRKYLGARDLRLSDLEQPNHDLKFVVTPAPGQRPYDNIEVRVWTAGVVPFTISSIGVERA
jgi:hypothetical protein